MNNYNKKIDYLVCKYFCADKYEIVDEEECKQIYNNVIKPKSNFQKLMMKCKNAMEFIKDNRVVFNLENIEKCYQIITRKSNKLNNIQKKDLESIVEGFHKGITDYESLVFIHIIRKGIFKTCNVEMAKLLHNFIRLKKRLYPIIFYHSHIKKIIDLIKDNEIEGILTTIKEAYIRTSYFNQKHRLIHLDEVKEIIATLKSKLVHDYSVKELYIYGSFSKGDENEYSDVDLYIKLDTDIDNKISIRHSIIHLLERKLGLSVDAKFQDEESKNFLKIDMLRHLKKII